MSPTKILFVVVILPMHDLYKGGKGTALVKKPDEGDTAQPV